MAVLGQKKLLYATLIVKFPFEKQSISINTPTNNRGNLLNFNVKNA
jgi:hypothetical protein